MTIKITKLLTYDVPQSNNIFSNIKFEFDRVQQLEDLQRKIKNIKDDTTTTLTIFTYRLDM